MKKLISTLLLLPAFALATEWHFNTSGIARFKAKEAAIDAFSSIAMIDYVTYVSTGRYSVHISAPLNTGELYQPVFTAPAGFNTHIDSQGESGFQISLTDANGSYVDCEELMTVSFNRLTEGSE